MAEGWARVRDEIRPFVEQLPGILREEGPAVILNV